VRIPRIYTPQAITPSSLLELEEGASHHLLKVLRMQAGRELILFNNSGIEFPAVIEQSGKKIAVVSVGEEIPFNRESPLMTELAIGISRGDRFDWVLQKATELGVTRIVPLFTERTEVRLNNERLLKRQQQWEKILIGACEQCQRNTLPDLLPATPLQHYLDNCDTDYKFILHHRSETRLAELNKPSSVSLLIGPEGGLNSDEILQAEARGFTSLALGPRVLRTETAPIATLAIFQTLWGDI